MKLFKLVLAGMMVVGGASLATAGSICPAAAGSSSPLPYSPDNANTGCNIVITIGPGGALSVSVKDNTPYDNSEDILVGVVNNSGATVNGLSLSGNDIFGFDADGICIYTFVGSGYCNASQQAGTDPGDYAGPTTSFPGWSLSSPNSGTVAFTPGLASGASTYFSLEGIPSTSGLTGSVTGSGGGTTSVPTLGEAGLFLLAMSLAGAAVWKLRSAPASR